MKSSVCHNCTDRSVGCHSICEKYIEESEENERIKKEIYIKKMTRNEQIERSIAAAARLRKRRKH